MRALARPATRPSSVDHFGLRCHVLHHVALIRGLSFSLRRRAGFSVVLQVRTSASGSPRVVTD